MHTLVYFQVFTPDISLPTDVTLVQCLAGVHIAVTVQVTQITKRRVADSTVVNANAFGVVCSAVIGQECSQSESLTTDTTTVRPLSRVHITTVCFHIPFFFEPLFADVAFVRPLIRMLKLVSF